MMKAFPTVGRNIDKILDRAKDKGGHEEEGDMMPLKKVGGKLE